MKDESIAALLQSGEILVAEDAVFIIDVVTTLFDKTAETGREHFLHLGIALLEVWRESIACNELDEADAAINMVMNKRPG